MTPAIVDYLQIKCDRTYLTNKLESTLEKLPNTLARSRLTKDFNRIQDNNAFNLKPGVLKISVGK